MALNMTLLKKALCQKALYRCYILHNVYGCYTAFSGVTKGYKKVTYRE